MAPPMKIGSVKKEQEAVAKARMSKMPMKMPVIAEAMMAETNGFFKRSRQPYTAGSVTDRAAVMPVDMPACLFSAFLALTPTASAEPAIVGGQGFGE